MRNKQPLIYGLVGNFGASVAIVGVCIISRSRSYVFTLAICPIFNDPYYLKEYC